MLPLSRRSSSPVWAAMWSMFTNTPLKHRRNRRSRSSGAAAAEKLRPRCIIVLDALAAATREKLCAVLQLTDTGLTPGSGVGNHRKEVSRRTLGVPVLALGLPTVIRAEQLVGEETPVEGEPLFVAPRDIDQRVRELSRMMAYGIDLALQPHLTVEDITGLLG